MVEYPNPLFMKRLSNILLPLFLLMLSFSSSPAQENGKEILRRSQALVNGKSNKSKMTMTIVRPTWTREVSMQSWSVGDEYYLILVTSPARDKGSVFMKREKEMWNWMPSIGRMIKIPPSMMAQSWMGSDFTNDDLMKGSSIVDDYDQKIVGEEQISGVPCWKIEMIPVPSSAVVWGKVMIWIAREKYWQMKAEYYDEDLLKINSMFCDKITHFNDRELPARLTIIPEDKPGHKTVIEFTNQEFDIHLSIGFFTQQKMKSIRPGE